MSVFRLEEQNSPSHVHISDFTSLINSILNTKSEYFDTQLPNPIKIADEIETLGNNLLKDEWQCC
jgi:hypothetical protein